MRSVNYEVKTADGATFQTMDYTLATQGGNRIVKTYLSDIDEKTDTLLAFTGAIYVK